MASKRRFEFVEGSSSKFWEVEVEGPRMTVCFGKVGTAGSPKDKTFASAAESEREAAKLIAEKTKKGYVEVGATAPSKAAAPAKAAAAAKAPAAASAKAAKAPAASAATSDSAPVQALLDAIRKKEKWLVSQLQPPASPAALEILRALEVPPLVSALYAMHDGTKAEFFGSYTLLPVEQIVSQRAMMNGILAKKPEWVESGNWNAKWVPFLADGDGQLYCVDPTGAFESGAPGQILFYDHETGPVREFASFDVLLGLLTTLAKKGLLDQEAQEESEEKYDELCADAKNIGMPKMPAKELKAVWRRLVGDPDPSLSDEQKLAIALPLARQYPAERDLWGMVTRFARPLEQWPLLAEAAKAYERLTPPRDRPSGTSDLVLALHRLGRDEEALAVLTTALKLPINGNSSRMYYVPTEADAAFRQRAWVIATEITTAFPHHKDMELWWERGTQATDPAERVLAFEALIALCKKRAAGKSSIDSYLEGFKNKAERQLALDRIAQLTGEAKLDALLAAAKRFPDPNSNEIWHLAATCAVDLGSWKQAEEAGAKLIELESYDGTKYEWCRYQVLALHELGRDEEALKVLKKALKPLEDDKGADFLVAIPWHEAREAGTLQPRPEDAAFEAKCFALATKVLPENPFAWKWRGALATAPSERKSAFEKVLALSAVELLRVDEDGEPYYGEESLKLFGALRDEAKEQLARG